MGTFNENGYSRTRLDEWVTSVKNKYFGIFGTNIDLSSDTMDGQLTGAFAESLSNEDQKAEDIYKSFNPAESEGVSLSTLVTINGITRNSATSSIATLTLSGIDGTVISAGSLVRTSDTDEQFSTDGEATIYGGVATVQATAINSGPVIAASGTITVIDSNIAGWTSVTNENDAIAGSDEESDAELRIRRKNSVAIASEGSADAVNGALLAVDGVISSVVKENDNPTFDGDGIPANSIAAVIEGGTDAEIGFAIWEKKGCGCGTYGIGTGAVTEVVEDSQGFNHDIEFSRPEDVSIYIDITISELAGFPSDGRDQIKQAIVDYFETDDDTRLLIGADLIYSEIYIPIMSVSGVSVTSLTSGITASPTGTTDITMDFFEIARFDLVRITV